MIVGWTTAQLRLIIILQLDTLGYFEQDKLTRKFDQFLAANDPIYCF